MSQSPLRGTETPTLGLPTSTLRNLASKLIFSYSTRRGSQPGVPQVKQSEMQEAVSQQLQQLKLLEKEERVKKVKE
jgi:hypothetical protein